MQIFPTTAHDQPALRLVGADGGEAIVLVHGAHLVSWQPVRPSSSLASGVTSGVTSGMTSGTANERLYLSPRSRFGPGASIRGGIPVIFPQFNQTGPDRRIARHGFARTVDWRVVRATGLASATPPTAGDPTWTEDEVALVLDEGRMADGQPWPHRFRLELGIRLGPASLDVRMTVFNDGDTVLDFSAALHSYFAVSDATDFATTRLEGVAGVEVSDRVQGRDPTPVTEAPGPFVLDGEVDRIYLWPASLARPSLTLVGGPTPLTISQEGFDDTVVWNPGPERARGLNDLADGDHCRFVCVEAAKATRPVSLPPGMSWTGVQRLAAG